MTGVRSELTRLNTPDMVPQTLGPVPAPHVTPRVSRHQSLHFLLEISDDIAAFAEWPTLGDLGRGANLRGYAFQSRDNIEMWLRTIGRACKVRPAFVRVATTTGDPLLLIPLCVERRRGIRFLEFVDRGVCDYNAPIVFAAAAALDRAAATEIWAAICRIVPPFDVALLQKCPEYVGEFANPFFGLCTKPCPVSGHYVELGQSSDNSTLLPTRDVKDSARQRKRLGHIGEVRFCMARTAPDIETVFDAFVRQKSRRYMETLGKPGFDVPGQIAYYRQLTEELSGRGVELHYMTVGGAIVATAWGLVADRRFYYLMCAYESGHWQAYSAGRLLLEEIANHCRRTGVTVLDLGIGDEPYKSRWRHVTLKLAGLVQPGSAVGWIYRFADMGVRAAKKQVPVRLKHGIKRLMH